MFGRRLGFFLVVVGLGAFFVGLLLQDSLILALGTVLTLIGIIPA